MHQQSASGDDWKVRKDCRVHSTSSSRAVPESMYTYMSARGLLGNWLHKSDWRFAPSRAPLARSCAVLCIYIWRRPGDFNPQSSTLNDSRLVVLLFSQLTAACSVCATLTRFTMNLSRTSRFFLTAAFCDKFLCFKHEFNFLFWRLPLLSCMVIGDCYD